MNRIGCTSAVDVFFVRVVACGVPFNCGQFISPSPTDTQHDLLMMILLSTISSGEIRLLEPVDWHPADTAR